MPVATEGTLSQAVFEHIVQEWGRPQVDLFATRENRKLRTFVSPFSRPVDYGRHRVQSGLECFAESVSVSPVIS